MHKSILGESADFRCIQDQFVSLSPKLLMHSAPKTIKTIKLNVYHENQKDKRGHIAVKSRTKSSLDNQLLVKI